MTASAVNETGRPHSPHTPQHVHLLDVAFPTRNSFVLERRLGSAGEYMKVQKTSCTFWRRMKNCVCLNRAFSERVAAEEEGHVFSAGRHKYNLLHVPEDGAVI